MYQDLESLGGKVLNNVVAFEKSIHGSEIKVITDEVYIKGEKGWFMVGRVRGGNEIEIGHSKIVDKYKRLIGDMIKETGDFIVAQKVSADWLDKRLAT